MLIRPYPLCGTFRRNEPNRRAIGFCLLHHCVRIHFLRNLPARLGFFRVCGKRIRLGSAFLNRARTWIRVGLKACSKSSARLGQKRFIELSARLNANQPTAIEPVSSRFFPSPGILFLECFWLVSCSQACTVVRFFLCFSIQDDFWLSREKKRKDIL